MTKMKEILDDNYELYEGAKHIKYEEELANDIKIDIIYDCFPTKHKILPPT